jgi:phage terminase small subunit
MDTTPKKLKLSGKMLVFVHSYLVSLNATAAAQEAGYKNPNTASAKLMKHPRVKELIEQEQAARVERCKVKADDVLKEMMRLAFLDPKQFLGPDGSILPLKDMPEDARRCISQMRITYSESPDDGGGYVNVKHTDLRVWDKVSCLKALMQHLGLLGKDGGNTNVNVMTLDWAQLMRHVSIEQALEHDEIRQEIASVRSLPRPVIECRAELSMLQDEAEALRRKLNGDTNGTNGHSNGAGTNGQH